MIKGLRGTIQVITMTTNYRKVHKTMTANSKNKIVQNKNSKIKMPMIFICTSIISMSIGILVSFIFKIHPANNDKSIDERHIGLVGIYRGDGTYKECMPGTVCKMGWSSDSYMQLNQDGTCYTNMSFFIGTNVEESSCQWYIEDESKRYIIFEFPDLKGIYHTGMGDKAKRRGNYEGDESLVILNAYLRKEE